MSPGGPSGRASTQGDPGLEVGLLSDPLPLWSALACGHHQGVPRGGVSGRGGAVSPCISLGQGWGSSQTGLSHSVAWLPRDISPRVFTVFFFFWLRCVACGILVPRPGIKPVPHAVEVQSLNHWTTREVPPPHVFNPPAAEGLEGTARPRSLDSVLIHAPPSPPPAKG